MKRESIWGPNYRALTIGIILVVTAAAFEGLAVTTIAPALAKELNGESLYGWVFSTYLLAQLIGTVITGQLVDRSGAAKPFVFSLIIFGIGIVLAALSPNMIVFIISRFLQGYGAGALVNCVYTAITLRYSDSLRPQILAVFSSAYILPGLIGPYVAGVITEQLDWRYVFWLILPFVFISALLTTPSFRGMNTALKSAQKLRVVPPVLLAVGTGIMITGLGMMPHLYGILLAVVGLITLVIPLRQLIPEGTFTARSGIPAIVASRGLFVAAYSGTQTYLVLALTSVLGFTADTAGLAVASAAISWSIAANLQAQRDKRDNGAGRKRRILVGLSFMIIGVSAAAPLAFIQDSGTALVVAIASQIIVGFGIGLAHPTSAAIAFSYSKSGEEGKVSADLAVADTFTPAISIGVAGALITITETTGFSTELGITVSLAMQLLLVIVGIVAAVKLSRGVLAGK
ncbi:MFS transporter [Paenibacillus sp. GSMTC-2017]|uniref:MFS transporter n=1 Tax=Paenibacillus sp. GSMTC-2017 TaxID=2794350 RepID=UPI0018D75FF5|nr:MFS transporter [Paenibacillus sp. GSMTC-2017]MBH5319645.1 MFS transporter [Paenibacillus sp. GSMTC-2017]